MKPLRVLVLSHPDLIPPDSVKGRSEREINSWKTVASVTGIATATMAPGRLLLRRWGRTTARPRPALDVEYELLPRALLVVRVRRSQGWLVHGRDAVALRAL